MKGSNSPHKVEREYHIGEGVTQRLEAQIRQVYNGNKKIAIIGGYML